MNAGKVLSATHMGAIAVQTVGSLDPYGGKTYLPPPRAYVAIFTLWGVLGLVASLGDRAARAAAQLSILVLLTAMVLGPFGAKFVAFLDTVARVFPAQRGLPGVAPVEPVTP